MSAQDTGAVEAALAAFFAARGANAVATPILQPAEPYLDTAGEALRRRIFLTRGEGGRSLCLRPDFTIPVALAHIERGQALPRRYSYSGLVFRQDRGDGPAEFRQAGIEDLGDPQTGEADARAIADALAALEACGIERASLETVVGDQGLFEAFLASLGLPAGWQRRLVRTFGNDGLLVQALESLSTGSSRDVFANLAPDLVDAARAGDVDTLADEISEWMEEGGLPPHRSRTAREVAERLVEKIAVAEARLDGALLERLRRFLAIDCPLDRAEAELTAAGVAPGASLALLEARNKALTTAGVDLSTIRYRAAFGRPLDYYTGMVFEISAPPLAGPLAGGGRYDRLVSFLGARETIPAVGFSLWLDRIETATATATGAAK
ncbi:ATP phosphoribosyltransferase regulatory subunit [Aureimonas mangrovi]|uniref:ATP phosphoribosyltransferase regulatory subunit n=1 Tax=Aureimonas mangrovi TaxID=2758041 RepID=UPI00163DA9C6|nr:ATP phosphoribosyltransferase regulatory subunit [Aureimonas mangrovi]